MTGTGQPWPFVPEFGQGRDYLNRHSTCCRVLSVPEMPPRFYTQTANNLSGPVLLSVPRFPKVRRPQHALRCSPEAGAWAPSSRASSLSRDLAYVTAGRHLGLWLSNKFPLPLCALFLEAYLTGRGFGPCVPVPALRCWCPRGAERG